MPVAVMAPVAMSGQTDAEVDQILSRVLHPKRPAPDADAQPAQERPPLPAAQAQWEDQRPAAYRLLLHPPPRSSHLRVSPMSLSPAASLPHSPTATKLMYLHRNLRMRAVLSLRVRVMSPCLIRGSLWGPGGPQAFPLSAERVNVHYVLQGGQAYNFHFALSSEEGAADAIFADLDAARAWKGYAWSEPIGPGFVWNRYGTVRDNQSGELTDMLDKAFARNQLRLLPRSPVNSDGMIARWTTDPTDANADWMLFRLTREFSLDRTDDGPAPVTDVVRAADWRLADSSAHLAGVAGERMG